MLTCERLESRENPVLFDPSHFAAGFTPISGWAGPVYETVGDFDGDGQFDRAFAAGEGGSARVVVWGDLDHDSNSPDWGVKYDAVHFSEEWRGGADLATCERWAPPGGTVNPADVLVIYPPGPGAGPVVSALALDGSLPRRDFFVYDPAFRGGIRVTSDYVDLDGNGCRDLLVTPGPGAAPVFTVADPVLGIVARQWFVGPEDDRSGMGQVIQAAEYPEGHLSLYVEGPSGAADTRKFDFTL